MKYSKILLAALTATVIMTGFILLAGFLKLPKMDPGGLLAALFGGNLIMGWAMHFIIGMIFAIPYAAFFNRWIPVEHKIARGAVYGILVFVFSEVIFAAINLSGYLDEVHKSQMAIMVFGNALACIIYGAALGAFFKRDGNDGLEDAKHAEG